MSCGLFRHVRDYDDEVVRVNATGTITGYVTVPDTGLGKVVSKIMLFKVQPGAKVYIMAAEESWQNTLQYKNKAADSKTTDANGKYEFTNLFKESKFKLIVDIDDDGNPESIVEDAVSGTENQIFVKERNTTGNLILSIKNDKQNYSQGDTMTLTVSGYTNSSQNISVKVWNAKNKDFEYWQSSSKPVNGDVSETFAKIIPGEWPSTDSSPGADYKAYVCVGNNELDSDNFNILGTDPGDTTSPTSAVIMTGVEPIGSGKIKLFWTTTEINDFGSYRVYYSTTRGFSPGATSLLTTVISSNLLSAESVIPNYDATKAYYFKVVVFDMAGNDSPASNEVSIGGVWEVMSWENDKWGL